MCMNVKTRYALWMFDIVFYIIRGMELGCFELLTKCVLCLSFFLYNNFWFNFVFARFSFGFSFVLFWSFEHMLCDQYNSHMAP